MVIRRRSTRRFPWWGVGHFKQESIITKKQKTKSDWLCGPVGEQDGERVFQCHWTGLLVKESEAIPTPPILPVVKGKWPAHPSYLEARKESYRLFCISEANCNTCKHLQRIRHEKDPAGFLKGKCGLTGESLTFHPDDPLHKECYEHRG